MRIADEIPVITIGDVAESLGKERVVNLMFSRAIGPLLRTTSKTWVISSTSSRG